MAAVETHLTDYIAENGGRVFLWVIWDSRLEQEDGTLLDPNATGRVQQYRWQNMGPVSKWLKLGTKPAWEAPPGTPDSGWLSAGGNPPNMYDSPWQIF